jgi:radical SAM superfamily enzyme YgiQ (UPF0313 family)
MNGPTLIPIRKSSSEHSKARQSDGIFLAKPPFFTPWTPPLGIAVLKAFLEQRQFKVRCFDYNTDSVLWDTHHKYFATVQALEDISLNDGYTRLWWILNAHMLAYVNGANPGDCAMVLNRIIPLYGLKHDKQVIQKLNEIVENYFKRLGEVTDQLSLSGYSVAGTSTYTTSLASSLFILRRIKQRHPEIKTVMGGGVFADDLALGAENLDTLLREYSFIDHVVLGEGELLFLRLLEGEVTDRVISLGNNKTTLEMKEVSTPDFSDLNSRFYYHLTIEGARSCPFQCSFCSETVQWGDYRKKPADQLAEQVTYLAKRYENNAFFMGDSLMNPYIVPFAKELLKRNANILYDGYLRADKPVTHRDWVHEWARSGLYRVRMGIESAAIRVLEAMDKMTTPAVISGALKTLASEGIRTTTYWIAGFPGETEADFRETLEFIREHHRYIYELEAHPYYYYPYGQIGSRLYECYSLYPDEVTDVIKFKVWDICNADPSRAERYNRLRRMCQLSTELGLPNIYTLEDRYRAEERWHSLQPVAKEVFEGTRLDRRPARVPDHRTIPFGGGSASQNGYDQSSCDSVAAYCVAVSKKLDQEILSASIEDLIRYNEALQLSIPGHQPAGSAQTGTRDESKVLYAYNTGEGRPEGTDALHHAISELVVGMEPTTLRSIRVALVENEDETSDVLLIVHRMIGDARTAVLLCEDLYRIYEQRSNGMEISLAPVQKELSDFLDELASRSTIGTRLNTEMPASLTADRAADISVPASGVSKIVSKIVQVETAAISSKSMTDCGWSFQEIWASILVRSFASSGLAMESGIDIALDVRKTDAALSRTAGPLTHIAHLAAGDSPVDWPVMSLVHRIREAASPDAMIAAISDPDERATSPKEPPRPLLSLEYLVDDPWFGNSDWSAKGFVTGDASLSRSHSLIVESFRHGSSIQLRFSYDAEMVGGDVVDRVLVNLVAEIESMAAFVGRIARARQYWRDKFDGIGDVSTIGFAVSETGLSGWDSVVVPVDSIALTGTCLLHNVDESLLLLSVLSALLSRLSGREEVFILGHLESGKAATTVPLRFYSRWDATLGEHIRAVQAELANAHEFSPEALGLLKYQPSSQQPLHCPAFDVLFVYGEGLDPALLNYPAAQRVHLTVSAARDEGGLSLQIGYDRSRLARSVIEGLGIHFERTLSYLAASPDTMIGEIEFEGERTDQVSTARLASDAFSF